jgi:hypothetical protein
MMEGMVILEINKLMEYILLGKIQNKAWKMIVSTILSKELRNYKKI